MKDYWHLSRTAALVAQITAWTITPATAQEIVSPVASESQSPTPSLPSADIARRSVTANWVVPIELKDPFGARMLGSTPFGSGWAADYLTDFRTQTADPARKAFQQRLRDDAASQTLLDVVFLVGFGLMGLFVSADSGSRTTYSPLTGTFTTSSSSSGSAGNLLTGLGILIPALLHVGVYGPHWAVSAQEFNQLSLSAHGLNEDAHWNNEKYSN